MNRSFKSVFNRALGVWQATSELTKAGGKKSTKAQLISPQGRSGSGTACSLKNMSEEPTLFTLRHTPIPRLGHLNRAIFISSLATVSALVSHPVLADCSPAAPGHGGTVTCSGGTAVGNPFNTAANNITVNVTSDGRIAPAQGQFTTALTLSGNNITLNNAGMIDPSYLEFKSQLSKGTLIGNTNSSNHAITNTGGMYGTFSDNSVNFGDVSGLALDLRNGAGGTTTIVNSGTIGGKPLIGAIVLAADAPVIIASGQGNTNFTNAAGGTVQGRIGLNGTSNTFINNGQILGSLYLGGGNDTFVADTGASVSSTGVGVAMSVPDQLGVGIINFASAGVVDGGTGIDTLTLKSDASNGANTATSGQFTNFENLNITGGRWTLVGRLANASNLTGGTAVLNTADNLGATAIVSGGALESGNNALSVTTALNLQSGGLTVEGANNLELAGAISGTGSLTKTGSGALSLAAGNTWSGGTILNGGSIRLGGNGALGTGAVSVSGSGTLTASTASTLVNTLAISSGTTLTLNGLQSLTLNGAISGGGNVIKAGPGMLTLGAVNTLSGSFSINGGTVAMGAGGTLAPNQAISLSSGTTLDMSAGGNQTIGSLAGSGGTVNLGSTTLTTGGVGTNTSYAGTIAGSGGLVKVGAGVQTLGGNNTFSGGVALNGGGLMLGNVSALGTGALSVGANVTLDTTSALTLANDVSLNTGGTINVLGGQTLVLIGVISGTGSIVKTGSSLLSLNRANTFSGSVNLNAGSLLLGNADALGTGALNVGGTVSLSTTTALNVGNAVNLANSTSLAFPGSQNLTLSGVVAGNGGLVKNGTSVLTLNNANTFTGGMHLDAGGLVVGNDTALGTGALTVGGATTLDTNGPVSLANNFVLNAGLTVLGSNSLTLDGNISGTGGLTKEGAATLTLNGTNTYTGGTNINAGTLALGLGASLASSGIVNLATGATFDLSAGNGTQTFGTLTGGGTINLGSNALVIGGPTNGIFSGSIGGTGGLIKEGTGTSILTGTNTFTGGTLINAGTLAIGAGGSLASTGAVTLAAPGTGFDISAGGNQAIGKLNGVAGSTIVLGGNSLTISSAIDGVYEGLIAGSGGLVKNGAGVQTLGGANTFSGGTTLNAGGLVLGNNGALGAGTLSVGGGHATLDNNAALTIANSISLASGAALDVLGSHDLIVTNAISGNGRVIKNGTSTLTLSGANSYHGGTTIYAGTLAIGAGGNLSSTGAVNLAGTGTLDISAGGNQYIGSLSGVTGSTVALGANTLTFGMASDVTFNGNISGTGGLIKNGAGVQTLGGASTFNGGVTLNAGGLNLGNDTALGTGSLTVGGAGTLDSTSAFTLANNINLNAGLTALGTNDMTLSGTLSGAGSLTKEGLSTLTLDGSNAYTGGTFINGGTLHVSNTNSSAVAVNSGGTLRGTGTVGSTSVANGAIVHVESGKLDINGDYQQSANGLLRFDAISAAQYGKLDVSGIASFTANAQLDVDVKGGNTLANNNVLSNIIKAGTLNASTFVVTDNSALFNFEAILNSGSVDLHVLSASTSGVADAVREQGSKSSAGAAKVLDGLLNEGASGDMATVVNAFGQLSNDRDVARATAQTLPVISGNQAVQGALSTFQNVVQNRNSSNSGASGLSGGDAFTNKNAWGKVFGSRAEQDNRTGAAGFTADTWGLALGADAEVAPDARFGVAYGYAKTSVDGNTELSGTAQSANIDSHVISAYGSKDIGGNRTFSFQGDIGLNDSKSTRHIEFGGLNRNAVADYRTYSAHVGTSIAQSFDLSERTTLTPALRADYTWLKSQGYSESGADALNLNVGSNKTDAFVIGVDTYLQHLLSKTSRLDANFGIGYDVINEQGNIVAAYAGAPGQSFLTTGIDQSPWLIRGGIGYSMLASNGTEVSFRYDAEGRSDFLNHTASVRAKWAF